MKALLLFMLVMGAGLLIYSLWETVPIIGESVHYVLDPTFGSILKINLTLGFGFLVLLITLITIIIQKYTSDQEGLKKLKEEQKAMQEEMKQNKNNPSKMMELQRKQLESIPKSLELTMKPLMYTSFPIILLFRWFTDTFKNLGEPKFFGFMGWFIFYLILSIVFTMILRKLMKVY